MSNAELIDRLRAWSRRYGPRSPERVLFLLAAERLEGVEDEIERRRSEGLTAEAIEAAIGGPLLPWQKKRLEEAA